MPRGELEEHVNQLPELINILSGGNVEIKTPEVEDDE